MFFKMARFRLTAQKTSAQLQRPREQPDGRAHSPTQAAVRRMSELPGELRGLLGDFSGGRGSPRPCRSRSLVLSPQHPCCSTPVAAPLSQHPCQCTPVNALMSPHSCLGLGL